MESMWYVVLQGCKLPIKLVQDYGINLPDGSGMNREVHVPFCEGLAGKFRRSTLHARLKICPPDFADSRRRLRVNQEEFFS